jgi:hypothetical protein
MQAFEDLSDFRKRKGREPNSSKSMREAFVENKDKLLLKIERNWWRPLIK